MITIDNKQLYNFTEGQTQVFLTSQLGDGCIVTSNSGSTYYLSNCKYKEYLEFKKQLIGKGRIKKQLRNGYSQTPIWLYYGGAWEHLSDIKNMELSERLANLDELGLALWFYDDGSLHKRDCYYNLNTQKFSFDEHEKILVPYFNSIGLTAHIRIDKSHSHPLYYLGFNKYEGAYGIYLLLQKFPVNCYSYKLWSSETIQKWSKLQERLKSIGRALTPKQKSVIWRTL